MAVVPTRRRDEQRESRRPCCEPGAPLPHAFPSTRVRLPPSGRRGGGEEERKGGGEEERRRGGEERRREGEGSG
jgi:hypothetical protein